jgi:hypothetical protein
MLSLCLAFSAHLSLPGDWNEVHPCIRFQEDAFIAGAFLNSEDRVSTYAGFELRSGDLFAEIGAVTGYSGADVLPFLRAGVELDSGVRLFVAPAYADGEIGAVLGVEMTLGEY